MKNQALWKPTKYVLRRGRLRACRDVAELGVGSRVVADAVAAHYESEFPRHARGRLLDLGCGKVPLYASYRPHVEEVVCVDWGNSLHAQTHVDHIVDLSGALPFLDASFDTVILSDVLEHLPDPLPVWREMARVLAPGGRLILNVPFLYRIHEAPHDYARYTSYALRRFADQARLQVVLLKPVGGSLSVLADMLCKHFEQVGLPGRVLASGLASVATALLRRGPLGRLDQASAEAFPLGYFMVAARPVGDLS